MVKLNQGQSVQTSSANLMEFLVQDLLDFAQIKAGKFRKNIKQFNIKEAIQQVLDIQSYKAQKQGIELSVEYANLNDDEEDKIDSYSPFIYSDMARIQQIILNLQSNALKFTEVGTVKVKCSIQEQEKAKFLKVSVIDSGMGISKQNQEKLFQLFGFLNDTEKQNTNGIGLGLMISNKLVSEFGGKFTVNSDIGQGSEFSFTIKLVENQLKPLTER